ncbi:MAG: hypothetical protein WC538_04940 [Thermoanaerobaculia bacterium]|jgi:hypothetical protein
MKIRVLVAALAVVLSSFAAEAATWVVVPHLVGGSLAINPDRIGTIYYSEKQDPKDAMLRILYGDAQSKVANGAEATTAWQSIQSNAAVAGMFLWVPHMEGTLGIPYRGVQALYFAAAADGKPATLRIMHDIDTKVIEGAAAEKLWKELNAR